MKRSRNVALVAVVLVAIAIATGWSWLTDSEDAAPPNSADRLILWTACDGVASLSDAELDSWRAQGVDGFVCQVGRLPGMGGSHDFTGDPDADLSGSTYSLQRSVRDSRIVKRARARGMKLYLGVYLANYYNTSTPLVDWFDDPGWSQRVLPAMRDVAGAARLLGFAGLAIDQELYPQTGGVETATWNWNYPGNTHTEAEVRAQATERGEELMSAILDEFPDAEFAVYHAFFPGDWNELITKEVLGRVNTSSIRLDVDFWDGMTSAEGYRAIRFWDNTFYKTPGRGSWESALTYNQNRVFATLSHRLSNWDYASRRVYVSPFSWINAGPSTTSAADDARPPGYVQEQLLAFRKWGMGGEFANFVYGPLDGFDYSPYASAMREASSAAEVDAEAPVVTVTNPADGSSDGRIQGTAHDNLAIRAVRWRDDRGASGVARLYWEVSSGSFRSAYDWRMRWSVDSSELSPGATEVTITAEDIKGNTSAPAAYAPS